VASRHGLGAARAESDKRTRQAEFDRADAARRDRDRAEDAGQRPGGEGLDDRDVAARDVDRAEGGEEDEEDREVVRGRRK